MLSLGERLSHRVGHDGLAQSNHQTDLREEITLACFLFAQTRAEKQAENQMNFLHEKGVIRRNGSEWAQTFRFQNRTDLMKIVTTERTVCVGTDEEHVKTFHQLKWTERGARYVR